jgi:hypothetical protein
MRKIALAFLPLLLFSLPSAAQGPNANVFFGYSFYNTDLSSGNRSSADGWEASVEGKFSPFLGFVADVDSHYGSANFSCSSPAVGIACPVGVPVGLPGGFPGGINLSYTEYNFLFGPRVSVSVRKFRPFAEALFGGAHVGLSNDAGSHGSFATAMGGGLDYKIIRPIAWRFQGDYVLARFFGTTQNNVRISTGLVLRF